MKQYRQLITDIISNGIITVNRTGIDTKTIFGYQMRFNLQDGFPAVTTKKLAWKSVVGELLWFLEGSTDERRLAELTYGKHRTELIDKTTIWTANANEQGIKLGYYNDQFTKELGPIYGAQWRNFNGVDQIKWIINEIKTNPDSRRLILTAWNVGELNRMSLPPCHCFCHFRVLNGSLHCQMYQRSADVFLGVPFNIASYALLTHLIARECNLSVGDYVHTIGDAHIYENHFEQIEEQIKRTEYDLPSLVIEDSFNLSEKLAKGFDLDDVNKFKLKNYLHHDTIKAPMAV